MESSGKVDFPYYMVEDVGASHKDETMVHDGEATQVLEATAQEEINTVSYLPFQNFDDSLFYDLESEEVLDEPLDALNPSCYDKDSDIVDNIDEFIHVGRRKWDLIGSDKDPIYDIEGHFQKFPLQLSYEVTNFDNWQQGDDIIADIFQAFKDDLDICSPNNFRSYLEDFDEYSIEHLDLLYEEYYQLSLGSSLNKSEEVSFLKQDTCDKIFHLPLITLPHYVTEGMVWKHVPYPKFFVGQSLLLKFRGRLSTLRRSLLSQSSSFPLRNCQSSFKFSPSPSQASNCEDVRGGQPSDSSSQSIEPLTFHDPFLRWIEHFA
jgi:hypothetical protein